MSATIRPVMSAGPPAANGTMTVTVLAGYSWAWALLIPAIARSTAAMSSFANHRLHSFFSATICWFHRCAKSVRPHHARIGHGLELEHLFARSGRVFGTHSQHAAMLEREMGDSRRCRANRLSPGETWFSTLARRGNAFIDVVGPFQCGAKRIG